MTLSDRLFQCNPGPTLSCPDYQLKGSRTHTFRPLTHDPAWILRRAQHGQLTDKGGYRRAGRGIMSLGLIVLEAGTRMWGDGGGGAAAPPARQEVYRSVTSFSVNNTTAWQDDPSNMCGYTVKPTCWGGGAEVYIEDNSGKLWTG